jgi:hypothetical protein
MNYLHSVKIFIRRIIINPRSLISYIISFFYYFKGSNSLYNKKQIKKKFLSINQTLDLIIDKRKSFVRFGDGDINVMMGMSNLGGRSIQKSKNSLIKSMKNLFLNKNLLIGLFDYLLLEEDSDLKKKNSYTLNVIRYRYFLSNYLNSVKSIAFGDIFRNKDFDGIKFRNYLKDKKIIYITRNFKNVRDLKLSKSQYFIWVPKFNAYEKIDNIKKKIDKLIKEENLNNKKSVFLIGAGSTAKILVEYIDNKDFQAIDIGALFEDLYIHKLKDEKKK